MRKLMTAVAMAVLAIFGTGLGNTSTAQDLKIATSLPSL